MTRIREISNKPGGSAYVTFYAARVYLLGGGPAQSTNGVGSGGAGRGQRSRFPLAGRERGRDTQSQPEHLERGGACPARVQVQPRADGVSRKQRLPRRKRSRGDADGLRCQLR